MIAYDVQCEDLGDETWTGQCLGGNPYEAAVRYLEARVGELTEWEIARSRFAVKARESATPVPLTHEVWLRYSDGKWVEDPESI